MEFIISEIYLQWGHGDLSHIPKTGITAETHETDMKLENR